MEFTLSQLEAIETRKKTLAVSAGAGSGKTSVLTHRILSRILEGNDIRRFLVVTFTKASAADLKGKLYNLILKESEKQRDNKKLNDALFNIANADISTVHSFCYNLIKENFTHLEIGHNFRIGEDTEVLLLLKESIEETTDLFLEESQSDFMDFIHNFTKSRNINSFIDFIEKIYLKQKNIPFWEEEVLKSIKFYENDCKKAIEEGFNCSQIGKDFNKFIESILYGIIKRTEDLYDYTRTNVANPVYIEPVGKLLENVKKIAISIENSFENVKREIYSFINPSLGRIKEHDQYTEYVKNEKSEIKKEIDELKNKYFNDTEEDIINDYKKTINLNKTLRNFLIKLNEIYFQKKHEKRILDYSDLEIYTLKLLTVKTPEGIVKSKLCKTISDNYDEILIDEYQDINPLQNMIFSLISKNNNRFMVGDAKQSIYRFRNASPDIFNGYIKDFAFLNEDKVNAKIFLKENFRSAEPVVNFINSIFQELYTMENASADYHKERLVYASENENDTPVEVIVVNKQENDKKSEAYAVAENIIKLVHHKNKYTYSDFTLLFRSLNNCEIYKTVFDELNIPYTIAKNEKLLDKPEILLAISILKVINNSEDAISLAAALKSPVFKLTANELYNIKTFYAYRSLIDCVNICANEYQRFISGQKKYKTDKDLKSIDIKFKKRNKIKGKSMGNRPGKLTAEKCYYFKNMLKEFSAAALEMPCSQLLWNMYRKTDLLAIVSAAPNGGERRNNLYNLYDITIKYEKNSFKGLSVFLDYLSEITQRKAEVKPTVFKSKNAVQFSTIHNSKGLEYPVAILCAIGKGFNDNDLKKNYIEYSNGFYAFNIKSESSIISKKTIIKHLANANELIKLKREELRCLYVALTRAKDNLIIAGTSKENLVLNNKLIFKKKPFEKCKSYLDWLLNIKNITDSVTCNFNIYSEDYVYNGTIYDLEINIEAPLDFDLKETLNYNYLYKQASLLPAKMAVSELRVGIFEDDEYTRTIAKNDITLKPVFINDNIIGVKKGNAIHNFMQFCNFDHIEKCGIESEKQRLFELKYLVKEDVNIIENQKIQTFLESDIYEEMRNSREIVREKRFNLLESSDILIKGSGEELLIQGVIDCFYINKNGNYTVLDYKTDYLPINGGEDILRERHKTQIMLYKRAIEQMTGKTVDRCVLYSFSLGIEVEVFNNVKKETAAYGNG